MELRHLRYFVAVAEELNFCRAAERLRIAQPPLSLQVRHLEDELGAPLFNRVKRRLVLTPVGQTLLIDARRLLSEAEGVKRHVREVAQGRSGRLAIGYVGTAMYDLLPSAIRLFRQQHPRVEFLLEEMSSAAQVQALRRGQVQLGLLRPPINDESLDTEALFHEKLMVALPDNHPLCRKSHIRLAELENEVFVLCSVESEPSLHRRCLDLFRQANFEPRIVQEVNHLQTQVSLVAAGLGVSLVPSTIVCVPRTGVVYREACCPQVALPKSAAWIKGSMSPQLEGFLVAMRQTVAHLYLSPLAIETEAPLHA